MPISNYKIEWGNPAHNNEAKIEPNSRSGYIYGTLENGTRTHICRVTNWVMGCCGAMSMECFGYSQVDWDEVKKLLSAISGQNSPKEIFFILTPYQTQYKDHAPGQLIQRPDVKLVDTFTNKVHSGTKLSLYRWSFSKDFSK